MPVLELRHLVGPGRSYSIHVEDKAGSWRYPEHGHDGFGDLLLVERGRMHQRVNGEAMVLEPGHVLLVRAGDRHELWGDGLRFVNLNLPCRELDRLSSFDGEALPLSRLAGAPSAPRAVLAASQRQEMQSDLAGLIAGEAEVEAPVLLARFLMRWLPLMAPRAAAASDAAPPAWFDPLLRRIEEGLGPDLDVADLPRLAGVSQAHLSRTFRRQLGVSPSQHLNRLRLRQAAVQLARTGRDILDIGYGLGFRSPSYFYRLFTRAHGMPPAAYRARHRMPG